MTFTAAQLPTHETEYTVVQSEWCERNHLLLRTVKLELQIALRSGIASSTVVTMGRSLELRRHLQTSGPVAVLGPASNFQH